MNKENVWKSHTAAQLDELERINADYRVCLDAGKTERECIRLTVQKLAAQGYRDISETEGPIKPGDKLYAVCMNKSIVIFQMGRQPLENGMNILGAHIDSPRIDVKQNPLYENEELAYLDTHYYGGIKKYQWVTLPLAIHGVVVKGRHNPGDRHRGEGGRSCLRDHGSSGPPGRKADGEEGKCSDRGRETGPAFWQPPH